MAHATVIVLCPRNLTASVGGPNGLLGDRVHQLPAVIAACRMHERVFVWPSDAVTRGLFAPAGAIPIDAHDSAQAVEIARSAGVTAVFGLYAPPASPSPDRSADCRHAAACHHVARQLAECETRLPVTLDPYGHVPVWRSLVDTVDPAAAQRRDPRPPWVRPSHPALARAARLAREVAGRGPFVIASPFASSGALGMTPSWWRRMASALDREVVVPVHRSEVDRADALFAGMRGVTIVELDMHDTAALAALPAARTVGAYGGRLALLAAASLGGALAVFARREISAAWAVPGMVVRGSDLGPEEAILCIP